MEKIAVLGAGITGITTAYKLMERGFDVTVIDRQRYAAMETSFANGGQLSASNAEVWTTWATVFKGLKWMFQADAPLLMTPYPGWHRLSWMAEFMANIPNYRANTIKTVELAIMARKHLLDMGRQMDVDFDHSDCGILHFYETRADLAQARKVNALLAKGGLERIELSDAEVMAKEPNLHGAIEGGFWTPSDSTGDIHKFTFGMAEALKARGVQFQMETEITQAKALPNGVEITDHRGEVHRFDAAVVCAGVGARQLARQLGERVNIYPVKGYSITVEMPDEASQTAAPTRSLLDDKAKIVTSRLGADRFRIAGTAEFNGENRDIRADRIKPLVQWCEKHFPGVSTERVIPWAGLRPMMPNMMPRVGQGRHPRVFFNTGHGHLGWTLSGATAEIAATAVGAAREASRLRPQITGAARGALT
ncbi:MAG: D-amino acid dehydrogenase [Pseudomonadota bacterium]